MEIGDLSIDEMSELIWQANAHLYNERPVSIQEFLNSPNFLGNIYPNIYPLWRNTLYKLFPSPFTSPYNEVIISASAGSGKCLGKGTPILMYDESIKNVEDVEIGDVLMGPDETPRFVMSRTRGHELMYKVTFEDGTFFTCNKSHILSVKNRSTLDIVNVNIEDYLKDVDDYWHAEYFGYKFKDSTLYKFTIEPLQDDEYYGFTLTDKSQSITHNTENCFVLGNGIVTHNTTTATVGMLYNIYKCGCLKQPAAFYGLAPNTKLIFAVFSANLALSGDVNWGDLTTAIKEMPWFQGKIVDQKGLDKKNGSLVAVEVLPQIYIQMGSRFGHGMGKALMEVLIDEAAFQQEKSGQAQKTYNETSSRMFTRFASYSKRGELPGHLWLISSPKDATDFLQQQIDAAKESNSPSTLIMDNIASWEANPANDSPDKFMMFIGNEFKEPHVIEDDEEISEDDLDYIIYPPMRFYDAFKRNPIANIMNLGGIRTVSTASLFQSQTILADAMMSTNPFTKDCIPLPFDTDNLQLMDFMDKDYFSDIRHPEANRFIHLDAAFSSDTLDRFGIAACYCVFTDKTIYSNIERRMKMEPDIFEKAERQFFIDFAIGIEPLPHQKVPFKKIENFIFYLIKKLGYPVASISADTFQSQRTLQEFESAKLPTENISVDRKKDPYLFLRDCVYDRDIVMPNNEVLKHELKKLREDSKKIDHPSVNGTKDIADAVCGALWACKKSNNIINLAKLSSAILNPYGPAEYGKLSETERQALEFAEFEKARAQMSSTILRNL